MKSTTILGQKSFGIASDKVEAWITETGGQVAPVTFHLPHGDVEPFSITPWAEESHEIAPILQVLRGDFFCMPFGGNNLPYGHEQYPIHGETANGNWTVESQTDTSLEMSLQTQIRPGKILKKVWTVPGQTVIYQRHMITEMTGPMCIGHHAMVKFKSPGHVSVSPFGFGQVFPDEFENPIIGGYSSLKPGAHFDRLDHVPSNDGSFADLSRYPAREGFEDLVMVYTEKESSFAWSAVSFPEEGYVWFSLKDPRVLSGTVLWHSNGGRHYAPWSGRHRGVLGVEEVTSYMHYGLQGSVEENAGNLAGFRTYFDLAPKHPLVVNSIIGVAPCRGNAGAVKKIDLLDYGILISMDSGEEINVELNAGEITGTSF